VARPAVRRRRPGTRIPPARPGALRTGPGHPGRTPSRAGGGEPVRMGQPRAVGRPAGLRQHRPGRLRDRDGGIRRRRASGCDAVPATRSRYRLPVRGRRSARAGHPGVTRRYAVPRARAGPDRELAARRGPGGRSGPGRGGPHGRGGRLLAHHPRQRSRTGDHGAAARRTRRSRFHLAERAQPVRQRSRDVVSAVTAAIPRPGPQPDGTSVR